MKDIRSVLICITLSLMSATASAEWKKIIAHPGQVEYADFSTIRIDGQYRRIWMLQDLEAKKCIGKTCYSSVKLLQEYDCDKEMMRTKYVVFYTGAMGMGQDVKTLRDEELGSDGKFSSVVPQTQGWYQLEGICQKRG